MNCPICIAHRIALGWQFKTVRSQQFAFHVSQGLTQFEVLHAIARLNGRHANN